MVKKLQLLSACLFSFLSVQWANAQLQTVQRQVVNNTSQHKPFEVSSRSATNPKSCTGDTSFFPSYGTTGYRFVTVRSGSSLGQFFGAPQDITVSGFRFFAMANAVSPARPVNIRLICNLYKAGADSLPTGTPLASDTVTVDTVMGSNIFLSQIQFDAVFKKPVTVNYPYIIAVESDSTAVTASLITNDWTRGDGKKKNIGSGSVSGKWYRNMQLNISGATFDADMQLYPFVKYNFGTDFTINSNCFSTLDTIRFTNQRKNNVSGQVYYNYYEYYNLGQFSHRWSYDGSFGSTNSIDGKFKPASRKNFDVRLISTVFSYRSGQCVDTTIKTVYFRPASPTLKKGSNACKGDTVTMEVSSDAGVDVKWYKDISSAAFHTGTTLELKNVQTTDSFYVRAENGPCVTPFIKVKMTVNDYPNKPAVKNDSICQDASANLQANSNLGNIEWFYTAKDPIPFFTGTLLKTNALFSDTAFFVRANNKGCLNKGGMAEVKALVNNNFAPVKPEVVTDTFTCFRPVQAMTISAKGADTIRWFDQATGGKVISRGADFTFTPKGRGTEHYYVEVFNGQCASTREHVTVNIYDYSAVSGLKNMAVCAGDSVSLNAKVAYGTVLWFDKLNNTIPDHVGLNHVYYKETATHWVYYQAEDSGCKAPNKDSIKITVNTPPVPTTVKNDAVCTKGNGLFQVNIPTGNVWWYYEDTSSVSFFKGNSINTGAMYSNMTYYYATEQNGCFSARKPLTITLKPRPTAGFTWQLRWQNILQCTPIASSGLSFVWQWGDGQSSTGLPGNHKYADKGNYTVRMIVTSNANGCKDTADIPVVIDHTGNDKLQVQPLSLFPNPITAGQQLYLGLASNEAGIYTFYDVNMREIVRGNFTGNKLTIPGDLTDGNYIISIQTVNGTYSAYIGIYTR